MPNQRSIALLAAFLAFAPPGLSQTPQKPSENLSGQLKDRRFEHVRLQLRTIVDSIQKIDKSQFSVDDDVTIQVLGNNSGSQLATLVYLDSFVNYLPALTRAGELVPYSSAMQKRLADSEKNAKDAADGHGFMRDSVMVARLPPSQLSEAALISLAYYYDKLQPGIYELKVRYRERNGTEIESDTVMFEVVQ